MAKVINDDLAEDFVFSGGKAKGAPAISYKDLEGDSIVKAIREQIILKQMQALQNAIAREIADAAKKSEFEKLNKSDLNAYLKSQDGRQQALKALDTPSLQQELANLEVAGHKYIHEKFKDSFKDIQWKPGPTTDSRTNTISDEYGNKICDLTERTIQHDPITVKLADGSEKTVSSYRSVDFPKQLEGTGPMDVSMAVKDGNGKNIAASKAVYFTAHYDDNGKLQEVSTPMPLKFMGEGNNAIGYIEREGEIYTLPVTKGKYQEMMQEVAINKGMGLDLSTNVEVEATAVDKVVTHSALHPEKPTVEKKALSDTEPDPARSMEAEGPAPTPPTGRTAGLTETPLATTPAPASPINPHVVRPRVAPTPHTWNPGVIPKAPQAEEEPDIAAPQPLPTTKKVAAAENEGLTAAPGNVFNEIQADLKGQDKAPPLSPKNEQALGTPNQLSQKNLSLADVDQPGLGEAPSTTPAASSLGQPSEAEQATGGKSSIPAPASSMAPPTPKQTALNTANQSLSAQVAAAAEQKAEALEKVKTEQQPATVNLNAPPTPPIPNTPQPQPPNMNPLNNRWVTPPPSDLPPPFPTNQPTVAQMDQGPPSLPTSPPPPPPGPPPIITTGQNAEAKKQSSPSSPNQPAVGAEQTGQEPTSTNKPALKVPQQDGKGDLLAQIRAGGVVLNNVDKSKQEQAMATAKQLAPKNFLDDISTSNFKLKKIDIDQVNAEKAQIKAAEDALNQAEEPTTIQDAMKKALGAFRKDFEKNQDDEPTLSPIKERAKIALEKANENRDASVKLLKESIEKGDVKFAKALVKVSGDEDISWETYKFKPEDLKEAYNHGMDLAVKQKSVSAAEKIQIAAGAISLMAGISSEHHINRMNKDQQAIDPSLKKGHGISK